MKNLNEFKNTYTLFLSKSSKAKEIYKKRKAKLDNYKNEIISKQLDSLNSFLTENDLWNLFGEFYDDYHKSSHFEHISLKSYFEHYYNSNADIEIYRNGEEYEFSLNWEETFRGEKDNYSTDDFPIYILFDFEKLKDELISLKKEKDEKNEEESLEKRKAEIKKEMEALNQLEQRKAEIEDEAKKLGM